VESRPGKKDPRAMRELMREVEAASRVADRESMSKARKKKS